MDNHYAGQPGQPDDKSKRQMRAVGFPKNNQRQLSPETMQSHDRDVSDEEYDERAKSQKMQTPCALPSVKDFDVPRKTGGNGWGHRYPGHDTERREHEYDCRIAQLL